MFDTIMSQVNGVLGITVGGVSLATIVGLVITVILEIRKAHKDAKVTKESVEKAFSDAILPRTVKLDLSSKIEEPIKDGFTKMTRLLQETLEYVQRGQQLTLSILNEFSHVHKLPEDIQQEIEDYIEDSESITVKLED